MKTSPVPGRFSDRELLFGAALAQLVMRNWPVMIKERPETENNLFEFHSGGGKALVLFKYATQRKTPWYFTVTGSQITVLSSATITVLDTRRYLALICHLEGVCLLSLAEFTGLVTPGSEQYGLSVSRPPNGQFRVSGPGKATLDRAIPRSRWTKEILMR